jgi:hypothetical protein
MKQLLYGALVALALAVTATSARADCCFEYNCCRHLSYVHTSKNRCFTFNSCSNGLPCGGGYGAPVAYGAPYPAPVYAAAAAAPAAAAPAATQPSFKAPPPAPATSSATGVQQAGYFYYGPTSNAGDGYNAGYNYGASYGYGYGYGYGYSGSYAQVPNYWY